ncbi:DNA-binding transcriptional LysR family regulator [Defluviimonas denitrificans]|jgi:DNA-binding transcriptional LysR family regulator|uniref:DNA-binding transcriptional LysR family regulator n=1 Tax=Albidovulum denitrificans TaxID=404881 RepID=A0A2S8SAG2_9RHOB|nr:LysR family transcriptional regulator [Defluviimonas denitrificans]PQV57739.1 DNA-binding transcriptional LysR family regulator [Defluviimonas denitrificans]
MALSRKLKPAHLRLILKIAETGQLQMAATALAMSQPAASRILNEIEVEAGTPLFLRHAKGMEPTQAGSAFLKHSRAMLTEMDSLETEMANIRAGLVGEVRVGSVTGPAVRCLVPAIRQIKEIAPGIEPTIEVAPSSDLVRGLEEGRFDFILARFPPGYDSRAFRVTPARAEVVSLVVRAEHPLAHRRAIPIAELSGYEWVIQERASPIRIAIDGAFHAAGAPVPANVTNTSSLLVMLAIIETSDAIVTLSEEVAGLLTRGSPRPGLVALDLADTISVAPYFIIQNRAQRLSRAAEQVLERIVQAL